MKPYCTAAINTRVPKLAMRPRAGTKLCPAGGAAGGPGPLDQERPWGSRAAGTMAGCRLSTSGARVGWTGDGVPLPRAARKERFPISPGAHSMYALAVSLAVVQFPLRTGGSLGQRGSPESPAARLQRFLRGTSPYGLKLTSSSTNRPPSAVLHAARPSRTLRSPAAAGLRVLLRTVGPLHCGGSASRFVCRMAAPRSWPPRGLQPVSSDSAAAGAVSEAGLCDRLVRAFLDKQSLADTAAERTPTAR